MHELIREAKLLFARNVNAFQLPSNHISIGLSLVGRVTWSH